MFRLGDVSYFLTGSLKHGPFAYNLHRQNYVEFEMSVNDEKGGISAKRKAIFL